MKSTSDDCTYPGGSTGPVWGVARNQPATCALQPEAKETPRIGTGGSRAYAPWRIGNRR